MFTSVCHENIMHMCTLVVALMWLHVELMSSTTWSLNPKLSAYNVASFSIPEELNPDGTACAGCDPTWDHFDVHNVTGDVYVGGSNILVHLGPDFTEINRVNTSVDMVDQCSPVDGVEVCKNLNKLLIIYYGGNKLITCGSKNDGRCKLRELDDISIDEGFARDHVVTSGKHTTAYIIREDKLYIAATRDQNRGSVPPVQLFRLSETDLLARVDGLYFHSTSNTMVPFVIHYVGEFMFNSFIYFVTSQSHDIYPDDKRFYSKINRVCHDVDNLNSFAEITIQCLGNDGGSYNLVQAAYYGQAGSDLATSIGVNPGDDILYGLFARSVDEESDEASNQSAICVFKLDEIEEAFINAIAECFRDSANAIMYLQGSDCRRTGLDLEDAQFLAELQKCNTKDYAQPKGSIANALRSPAIVEWQDALPTSIITTTERHHTIAFIGTADGQLMKLHIKSNNESLVYETLTLGSRVLRDMKLDADKQHVIVLTELEIYKLAIVKNCNYFSTCEECIGFTDVQDWDPYCGWCALEERCTRWHECNTANDSTRWLSYNETVETQCPIIHIRSTSEADSTFLGEGTQQTTVTTTVEANDDSACIGDQTLVPYPLTWPNSSIGHMVESFERCPGYLNKVNPGPRATRQCNGDSVFSATWQQVIVSDCLDDEEINEVNNKLVILSETNVTVENVAEVAFDLARFTNNTQGINATGLDAIASSLQRIVDVELQIPSAQVTGSVIETVDNILNINNEEFIQAFESKAPKRLLKSLEEQISSIQTQDGNFTTNGDNIDVYALQIPQTSFDDGIGFASVLNDVSRDTQLFNDPEDIPLDETETAIVLPAEVVARYREAVNDSAIVPVSFVLYQNSKLFQSKLLREQSVTDVIRQVGSRIISATIEGLKITNLVEPVVLTFQTITPTNDYNTITNVQCVFWDFEMNAGSGDWSTDGCKLTDTTDSERTICECDHLTSFAVLIDVHGQQFASLALDVISQIGCGISIAALIITLITYLSAKSLRSRTPMQILICLSFTLLCLYIVFVVGVDQNDSSSGCVAIAVLLHYLTLTTVAWMGIEAINLYLYLIRVHNSHVSYFMQKACLLAWGGPLIPVILVLAIDKSQYRNDHHCFMQPSYAFYFADLLLIFLILTCNLATFVTVTYKLTCGRKKVGRSSNGDNKEAIRRAVNSIAISFLLGLTWIFGFFTIIENRRSSLAFQVLFCLFNSLQGFSIFLLFCVRSPEVRSVWKGWYTFGTSAGTSDFSTPGKSTVGGGKRPKSKSNEATVSTSKGESLELSTISKQ